MKNVLLPIFLILFTACESQKESNGFARGYDGPWKIRTQAGATYLVRAAPSKDL